MVRRILVRNPCTVVRNAWTFVQSARHIVIVEGER